MTAKLGAAGGAGAKFSPLEVSWANAYWPGGPAFKAEGYTDGQVMNAGEPIPDEAGLYDMTAVAYDTETSLSYVDSSNVNSQPAIRAADNAAGVDHPRYSTGAFTTPVGDDGGGDLASATGWSLVVIWNQGPSTGNTFGSVVKNQRSANFFSLYTKSDGTLQIKMRSGYVYPSIGWSAGDTIAVLAKGTNNLNYIDVDGTNYLNATGSAAYSYHGMEAFMSGAGLPMNGDLAFVGLYEGDCTGDTAWSDFETWAADELGATV